MMSLAVRRLQIVCVSAAMIAVATIADAQSKRAMTPVDLIEVPRVLDPQLSPDGKHVVYIVDRKSVV